jgi:tRNA dimethylallyltransferase
LQRPRIWLIAGPTASGKTALALTLAQAVGGEIVNADSMQVYRDLRVLTARPTPEEEARAPHHLFGVANATEAWSVGRWLGQALAALDAIASRGRPAIVVGGTGLYFRALTRGLADMPAVPPQARDAAAAAFETEGEVAFRQRLATLDPAAAARIAPGDRQRLVRAMAVAQATGRALSDWHAATEPPLAAEAWRGVVLDPPREALYARCDARLADMIATGALEEVRALAARDLDPGLPALKAVGYRELAAFIAGEVDQPTALAAAQQATRNYAKRQATWFRNQTPDWTRIDVLAPQEQWRQFIASEGVLTDLA